VVRVASTGGQPIPLTRGEVAYAPWAKRSSRQGRALQWPHLETIDPSSKPRMGGGFWMAEYIKRLGGVTAVAVMLVGCADTRMSDSDSARVTPGSYGIPSDAGSHGSVYSWLFGGNDSKANQSVADARPAAPSAASSTTASVAPSPPAAPSAATSGMAAEPPPPRNGGGSYGIPSDAGSHGSVYSYLFGQNGKPAQVLSGKAAPVTSYGIPADAGSHGSVYSWLFGPKDTSATPSTESAPAAAKPNAPPPSQ
jgi:hypothetical protein